MLLTKNVKQVKIETLALQLSHLTQRKYVLPTSSGTSALITALRSANIPLGAEVIMPAICCPAVLCAIQWAGFTPVLADINLNDFSLDTDSVEKVISAQTAAIIAVHNYGHYCQISSLIHLAKQHNLLLIEDACLAMGGTFQGKPLGSFGDISIISFGYDKIVNANYGGALLTNNSEIAVNADKIIAQNDFFKFSHEKTAELASIYTQLTDLPKAIIARQTNVKICQERLSNAIKKPNLTADGIYWRYPALVNGRRTELIHEAEKEGIIIPVHYKSLHYFFTGLTRTNAELFSENVINLFIRPDTEVKKLNRTINFINEFYQ
ncbi:MAG: DegT/DnrJ/EryC1/StrS family aminotransferase [Colwelliaceae bacterium]|nr:DegT/DnrJ/EryC1/StrS family aminotransferase [Colwelliaceae bacterium]